MKLPSNAELEEGICAGNRSYLARAITLIESRKPAHQERAQDLLMRLMPRSGKAHRIGITGVPGVGKSTFIDAFGSNLTAAGHKVAVLAVDPSSSRTGGSILGDKTRMARLSVDANAFIRPSPTSGTLGGVARATRESMILCEAAGFDVLIVETVGVGQSEITVASMVDFFLLLMLPGAGDELQGIKKGVLEVADMVAVNKADGDNKKNASAAQREYKAALHIFADPHADWTPPVLLCSGIHNVGLDTIWDEIENHRKQGEKSGKLDEARRKQAVQWMWSMLEERLMSDFRTHPNIEKSLGVFENNVSQGKLTPVLAVKELLHKYRGG